MKRFEWKEIGAHNICARVLTRAECVEYIDPNFVSFSSPHLWLTNGLWMNTFIRAAKPLR